MFSQKRAQCHEICNGQNSVRGGVQSRKNYFIKKLQTTKKCFGFSWRILFLPKSPSEFSILQLEHHHKNKIFEKNELCSLWSVTSLLIFNRKVLGCSAFVIGMHTKQLITTNLLNKRKFINYRPLSLEGHWEMVSRNFRIETLGFGGDWMQLNLIIS
jgi:hypothetical protein